MNFSSDELKQMLEVLDAPTNSFSELAVIAGLHPRQDFRGADLRGVNFSTDDLTEFDFANADLSGADFSNAQGLRPAMFVGAKCFQTRWPEQILTAMASEGFSITAISVVERQAASIQSVQQMALVHSVRSYTAGDASILGKAYNFAVAAHGASYDTSHILGVATILTELKLSIPTVAAGLLHDTLEDSVVTPDGIKENFGEEIAGLVEGVSKLSQLELFSERTKQAENFRKLMLAMSNDIRVLLVKLADRLHNMRKLKLISQAEKRNRIAQEAVDIYAPLAGRIGMQTIREELEDLAFAELQPEARNSIVMRMAQFDHNGANGVSHITDQLKRRLAESGIQAAVSGRAKSPYSIWRKLKDKQMNFEQLSDILGFRVIVANVEDCYGALRVLHTNWQMVPERFKDFISTSKPNGYRSIHTTLIGPERQRIEVQIRTQEMHDVAERGVAGGSGSPEEFDQHNSADACATEWLRDMVELLERGDNAEDFLEHSRLNMYQDQVFAFTPKGDLIALPRGATPIDFAYAVHTELGHHTVGAKINGAHVPLHTPIRNGDQIEVIKTKKQTPSPVWEQFVTTGRARAEIRRFLRRAQHDEHVKFGRQILEKVYSDEGFQFTEKGIDGVARKLRVGKAEGIYAEVGRGSLRGHEVLKAVYPEWEHDTERNKQVGYARPAKVRNLIRGLKEGITYKFGECCHPLPGDRVVGLLARYEGAVIHTVDCEEIERAQNGMEDWLDVAWNNHAAESGPSVARILVRIKNVSESLAGVVTMIASSGGSIVNMKVTNRDELFFETLVDIEVRDVAHLQNIIAALRADAKVESVERLRDFLL